MRSIAVVVQACVAPGRPGWDEVRQAIEASDIGSQYELLFHPPGCPLADYILSSFERLYESGADLCLRLEDDIDVNEHIVHNVTTWPMLDDQRFGGGWLFDPGGSTWKSWDRKAGRISTEGRWHHGTLTYTQACLFHRKDLPSLRAGCARWFKSRPVHQHQYFDGAISHAMTERGLQIAIHGPPLVEHRIDLPSLLKHRHSAHGTATTRGAFAKHWRREVA
jgi:hypothetical protein